MKTIDFQRSKISLTIIFIFFLILLGFFCYFNINITYQQNKELSLVHKSEFYKLMYKENDIDFIKTAEKELENIDSYIERYKEDFPFYFYIKIQRDCLFGELNNKVYHLLIKNQTIREDTDYNSFLEQHPESLSNLKEKGRILEYKEIDYIDLFRKYCIEWDEYDKYLYFCENHSITPVKEITEYDKQNNDSDAQNYFPKGVLSQFQNEFLSSFLDYFDPVSIVSMKKGQNEIRFYCIDSGMMKDSYSYVIKVNWTRFSRSMEVIVEDSPARHEKIEISKSELDELIDLLDECDFYNQETSYDVKASDANEYICEANINGKYKLVSRCDYAMEPFMYKIQNFLVKKTGGAPHTGKRAWEFLRN